MRILSIGNFGTGWDGSICDEEHIARALERLGHEVTRMQRENIAKWFDEQGLIDLSHFEFILIAQWDHYPLLIVDVFHQCGASCIVYWAFDYQTDGQEWHERLIKEADIYLSKRIADSKYPNWQWLPQDFAPEFLAEESLYPPAREKNIEVLFTGSYLPWAVERTELLKAIDEEFDLHVCSVTADQWQQQGLKNVHAAILDHDLPALINRAKINISIDHTIEAGYWSDRNAQIMACGGFVLFKYVPMSETVFGHNVAYFYNTKDCLSKIRHYLDDEFQREHIAQVGRGFAYQNLMVGNRVEQLLTIVENYLENRTV